MQGGEPMGACVDGSAQESSNPLLHEILFHTPSHLGTSVQDGMFFFCFMALLTPADVHVSAPGSLL